MKLKKIVKKDRKTCSEQSKSEPDRKSILLPGVSSFFDLSVKRKPEESSSSDEEESQHSVRKKKKLTVEERKEEIRRKNEEIYNKEQELADLTNPKNAEQFDRLLLGQPNNSVLWTKYISYHIATTEINKARTIARKALETIDPVLTDEKFNIWVVLLNLENMFGTKEIFESVFQEAIRYCDPMQIYLRVIQMLADGGKHIEMEEKIRKAKGKFKSEPTFWLELGKTYYQVQNFKEARNCKDCALRNIIDKKSQMNLIVRFAIMEFRYGEVDHGCAIFEAILSTEPKKINIWFTYVDQLVKKGKIDQTRQVLERAVSQKLNLKSMKSLFLKFRKFEEEHGNLETLESVKKRAQEYISKIS